MSIRFIKEQNAIALLSYIVATSKTRRQDSKLNLTKSFASEKKTSFLLSVSHAVLNTTPDDFRIAYIQVNSEPYFTGVL